MVLPIGVGIYYVHYVLPTMCHRENGGTLGMVPLYPLFSELGVQQLGALAITRVPAFSPKKHVIFATWEMAGSKVAEGLLKTWNETLKRFTKVPLKRPVFGEVWKLFLKLFLGTWVNWCSPVQLLLTTYL